MKALIVEDDLALSDVLTFTLRRAGFDAIVAHDGPSALELWADQQPGLVLLDLNLPRMDGLAVCRRIRAEAKTPIIILSVRDSEDAVVQGLELGADDYLVKPFSPRELLARIRAVLRRAESVSSPQSLTITGLILDRSRNEVQREGSDPVRLTPLEAKLLETLMRNAGQVLSADALIDAIWGAEGADRGMLKQLVYRLRNKIGTDSNRAPYIETIPGVGYGIVEPNG